MAVREESEGVEPGQDLYDNVEIRVLPGRAADRLRLVATRHPNRAGSGTDRLDEKGSTIADVGAHRQEGSNGRTKKLLNIISIISGAPDP